MTIAPLQKFDDLLMQKKKKDKMAVTSSPFKLIVKVSIVFYNYHCWL